jgi:uncharacterized protein YpiB (UPF0302 family)
MELIFEGSWKTHQYLGVLEDNPFHKWNDYLDIELEKEVEQALATLTLNNKIQLMMKQIDTALENDDRESFIQLSDNLKEIKKNVSKPEKKPNH